MRFVPNAKKPVTLWLKDAALAGARIDYRLPNGQLVDELLTDPSFATTLDPHNGKVSRTIKHFSGDTVTADRVEAASPTR